MSERITFKCFLVEPTDHVKEYVLSGPAGSTVVEILYRRVDTDQRRWDSPWAPGASFGRGGLIKCFGQLHLLIDEGWYINLEANGRQLRGIPPMVTVIHSKTVCWELKDGIFSATDELHQYLRGKLG